VRVVCDVGCVCDVECERLLTRFGDARMAGATSLTRSGTSWSLRAFATASRTCPRPALLPRPFAADFSRTVCQQWWSDARYLAALFSAITVSRVRTEFLVAVSEAN
jgi:hypothetical protein